MSREEFAREIQKCQLNWVKSMNVCAKVQKWKSMKLFFLRGKLELSSQVSSSWKADIDH